MTDHLYCAVPKLALIDRPGGWIATTTVLMGAWLKVLEDDGGGWVKVGAFGKQGFVRRADTSVDDRYLKLFFIDVGQGDACLIEAPGRRLLVDGGQYARNTHGYLAKWKYRYLIAAGHRVRLDAVVVSHFDADHFAGLTKILADQRFEIGTLYHNGIARFHKTKSERSPDYDRTLGRTDAWGRPRGTRATRLETSFSTLADAERLLAEGGLMSSFRSFLEATVAAHQEGRLGALRRITSRDRTLPRFDHPGGLVVEVLGPVPTAAAERISYAWLEDDSHTVNGHSVVLRLEWGARTILLGGDLNIPAEEHLLAAWGPGAFQADVAKACHHGASEFTTDFMRAVEPYATVFSSGDNENYAHPRADALGCAGRYARGDRPLVFSTELARSFRTAEDIHYGLINCRTDGETVVMAQMLETRKAGDPWDLYTLP